MTPATEKAAPIPADVLALAAEAVHAIADAMPIGTHRQYIIARAILADREARSSLPDSREERIRAEAAEDERDRLLVKSTSEITSKTEMGRKAFAAAVWLAVQGTMLPAERARARQGGNNG